MKKTLSINISGIIFNIDEDAYKLLNDYLSTIRGYFNNSEGQEEIMADIEARIAEMLQEKVSKSKQVITIEDIEAMIAILGQPEDYIDPDEMESESFQSAQKASKSQQKSSSYKRLYRDKEHFILGGVCSGVGHYLGIDPVWVRLAFLVAFFGYGTGLLAYIILWIIIPEARTTAEKLEMRGEPVNVSNIGKTIENEMENVKDKFDQFRKSGKAEEMGQRSLNFIQQLFQYIFRFIKFVFTSFGKFLGVILILAGGILLISFFAGLFGTGAAVSSINTISFENLHIFDLDNLVFQHSYEMYLALIGLILTASIPIVAIIFGGIGLIVPLGKNAKNFGFSLLGLWLIGLFISLFTIFKTIDQFSSEGSVSEITTLKSPANDTLKIETSLLSRIGEKKAIRMHKSYYGKVTSDSIYISDIDINIVKSSGNNFELLVKKTSRGDSYTEAEEAAEKIVYNFSQDTSNVLKLDGFFHISNHEKWKAQDVYVEIGVPIGKTVYLDRSLIDFLDDVDNTTNTYDKKMVNHFWTMTDIGLMSPDFHKKKEKQHHVKYEEKSVTYTDSTSKGHVKMKADEDGFELTIQ